MNLTYYDHGYKSTTKGGTVQYDIRNKNVSHLVISQRATTNLTASSFTVKVELFTPEFSGVLIDSLPNTILEKFSDAELGHPTQTTTSKKAVINLGSIRLRSNESLLVTITDTATGTHTSADFDCISLYNNSKLDYFRLYQKSTSKLNSIPSIVAVCFDTSSMSNTDSIDVAIDNYSTVLAKTSADLLNTILRNNILSDDSYKIFFFDEDGEPHKFDYEYKGNSNITVYYVKAVTNYRRAVQSAIEIIDSEEKRLIKAVEVNPDLLKVKELGGISLSKIQDVKRKLVSDVVPDFNLPNFSEQ